MTVKDAKIKDLVKQLKEKEEEIGKKERNNLPTNGKGTEAKTDELKSELKKLKLKLAERDHNSAKDLMERMKELELKNEEMKIELLIKEDLIETTQKDQIQDKIRIQELESKISEIKKSLS